MMPLKIDQGEDPPNNKQCNPRNGVRRDQSHRNVDDVSAPSRRVKVEALTYDSTHNPYVLIIRLVNPD